MRGQETRKSPSKTGFCVVLRCGACQCGKQDLNLHPLARTRPSTCCKWAKDTAKDGVSGLLAVSSMPSSSP